MYYGLIDLGSNTVRLVIYKFDGEKYSKAFSEKSSVGILNYIEQGNLSLQGIDKLVETLDDMNQHIKLVGCKDYWCFATASLRHISNLEEVINTVKLQTGIIIQPITGNEEAYYDYVSLKNTLYATDFIGCDIGGGSAQIILSEKGNLAEGISLPIGSLKMYKDNVEGFFPTKQEKKKIREYVEGYLKDYEFITDNTHDTLYVMGGTARAIAKLHREMETSTEGIHGYTVTVEDLKNMQKVMDNLGMQGAKLISKILPERMHTIIPGMVVLHTLAKSMKVKQIVIIKKGIREGFLIEKLMRGDYNERKKI